MKKYRSISERAIHSTILTAQYLANDGNNFRGVGKQRQEKGMKRHHSLISKHPPYNSNKTKIYFIYIR